MISPGLVSSLQTLAEILASGDLKEGRAYLDSIIQSIIAVQEHELERDAMITSRTLFDSMLNGKGVDPGQVQQALDQIHEVLTLKGLIG